MNEILKKYLEVVKNQLVILTERIINQGEFFANLDKNIKELGESIRNQKPPEITIETPDVVVPEIKLPTINVPQPKVTVNVPEIKIPDIKLPDIKIPPQKNSDIKVNFPEKIGVDGFEKFAKEILANISKKKAKDDSPIRVIMVNSKGDEIKPFSGRPQGGVGYNNPFTFENEKLITNALTEETGQSILAVLQQIRDGGGITPPSDTNYIITDTGDILVTDTGDNLIYA